MDAKYLADIKAREQAATPGPWAAGDGSKKAFMAGKNSVVAPLRVIVDRAVYPNSDEFNQQTYSDIAFIAHSRTYIPALVAEVEHSHSEISYKDEQIDALKKALETACKNICESSDDCDFDEIDHCDLQCVECLMNHFIYFARDQEDTHEI